MERGGMRTNFFQSSVSMNSVSVMYAQFQRPKAVRKQYGRQRSVCRCHQIGVSQVGVPKLGAFDWRVAARS